MMSGYPDIAAYNYFNSTINTYLRNMLKVYNTCMCIIFIYTHTILPISHDPRYTEKKNIPVYVHIYIYK